MAAVDGTLDVVDGSTLVFFGCFVFGVYYHRAEGVRQLVVHLYIVCQAVLIVLPRMVVPT